MAHQFQLITVLAAIGLVLMCSCTTESERTLQPTKTTVFVSDTDGEPIVGAKVYSVSESITVGPKVTDSRGLATVPTNLQGTKWVRVVAEGFEIKQSEVLPERTLRVVLKALETASLATQTME